MTKPIQSHLFDYGYNNIKVEKSKRDTVKDPVTEYTMDQQFSNPILQILELRVNDKLAQDFVRKQKARIIE
ncbi:hypothetical protein CVS40_3827 [Lucilia cuprina]|nr:hypothetical protein CVS40_3827 [Lucilia cuprina]